MQVDEPCTLKVLSGAALVIELKKRLMMLVYDDYKDEAAALVQPLVSAASNDMLEAAAEAVEAISKDLGMGKQRVGEHCEQFKFTRNKLMGLIFINITVGGSIFSEERLVALGKCVNKHLGMVRKRAERHWTGQRARERASFSKLRSRMSKRSCRARYGAVAAAHRAACGDLQAPPRSCHACNCGPEAPTA